MGKPFSKNTGAPAPEATDENLGFSVPVAAEGVNDSQAPAKDAENPETPSAEAAAVVETPAAPEAEAEAVTAEAPGDEYAVRVPKDFAESLAELRRIQGLPENSQRLEARKAKALATITGHMHRLQQGVPAPPPNAAQEREHSDATTRHANEVRLEALSNQQPAVRELLAEHQRVLAELEELRKAMAK